jgi:hypothetical protein
MDDELIDINNKCDSDTIINVCSDNNDKIIDNERKIIERLDSIVDDINNIKLGKSRYFSNEDEYHRISCRVEMSKIYNFPCFMGKGSKNLAKYYMNKNKNYKYLLQITCKKTRSFVPITSWNIFYNRVKNMKMVYRNIYEVVNSDKPCKPYLDIEWLIKDKYFEEIINYKKIKHFIKKNDYLDNSFFDDFVQNLKNDIIYIFKEEYDIDLLGDSIYISSSHSTQKISFHVVITHKIIYKKQEKTLVYKINKKKFQDSAWDLYLRLIEHDRRYTDILDEAVYSTDREFRALYSNKSKEIFFDERKMDFRPLIKFADDLYFIKKNSMISDLGNDKYSEYKKYLITPFGKYHCIKTPLLKESYILEKKTKKSIHKKIKNIYYKNDYEINYLLNLIKPIHPTAFFTGKSSFGNSYRFSYEDRTEKCYTGNTHSSNGFVVIKEDDTIYMKCFSDACKSRHYLVGKPKQSNRLKILFKTH